jgi:hypothetical protein
MTIFEDYIFIYITIAHILSHCYPTGNTEEPESTVNTLINERQKGKQKVLWSREGAHNVLQIRAALRSESWHKDWKSVEDMVYKLVA